MKSIPVIAVFCLLATLQGFAQNPAGINSSNFNPSVDSVAEKLVEMAYLNARLTSMEHVAAQSYNEYKASKMAILKRVTVAGNLNELSIKQSSAASADPLRQSTQFPRYNIGVVLPLGTFVTQGKQNKANFHRYQSMVDQVKIEKQNIREEVLLKYEDYQYTRQLLAMQQEVMQDAKILMTRQEEKFSNGELSLEVYTTSVNAYNNEQVKELGIVRELRTIEIQLETLIGMRLADALAEINNKAKSGQ